MRQAINTYICLWIVMSCLFVRVSVSDNAFDRSAPAAHIFAIVFPAPIQDRHDYARQGEKMCECPRSILCRQHDVRRAFESRMQERSQDNTAAAERKEGGKRALPASIHFSFLFFSPRRVVVLAEVAHAALVSRRRQLGKALKLTPQGRKSSELER